MMKHRNAFTLIELLVVIAVIAVLAGLLIPTVSMVKKMMSNVKCGNQLQQIGAAIEVYKGDNNDLFPARLLWRDNDPLAGNPIISDLFHSGGPLTGLKKLLICPRDGQLGKDIYMGRMRPGMWDDLSAIYTPDSSYCYEVSGVFLTQNLINYFFEDLPTSPNNERPALNTLESTWAAGKAHQIRFGNLIDNTTVQQKGMPFSPSFFPIIRCYWHTKWTGDRDKDKAQKHGVKNVSWGLNIFDSSPYWESDVNPLIR